MTSKCLLRVFTSYRISKPTHYVISPLASYPRNAVQKRSPRVSNPSPPFQCRAFNSTNNPPLHKLGSKSEPFPRRPKPPPESEIEESFLKGSGPGGQKINKTNSAVQLKHIPTGLVVKCQATRSRSQNRTIARRLLADKLDDMRHGDESRSSIVGEVKRKKKASSAKKSRRKYRKLEEEKGKGASSTEEQEILEEEEEEEEDNEDSADLVDEEPLEKGREPGGKDEDMGTTDTVNLNKIEQQSRI
ncbi:RF-1 domain-containing protein [Xylaria bambusicola]|uniref:RF-1 domain-containing protein n=1 Tax=Xylaria bambusicola TaxID=326684 RepID=UPI00200881E9|nr:RF-1 domain-containing protein [Xylaria bambusicola]KAI0514406.1 RF-1 domain-containing protein [Xylaria bambusicola]